MFKFIKKTASNQVDYGKKIIGVDEIKANAIWIRDMYRALGEKSARVETFEQAKARLNVTEEHIKKVRQAFIVKFYITFIGALICLYLLVSNMINGQFGATLSPIGVGAVLFAFCFQSSFRAYQIKIRELCGVQKWIKNTKEWLPH